MSHTRIDVLAHTDKAFLRAKKAHKEAMRLLDGAQERERRTAVSA